MMSSRIAKPMEKRPFEPTPDLSAGAGDTDRLHAEFSSAAPFPHVQVESVLGDEKFVEALEQQLMRELPAGSWEERRNDLYDFEQTDFPAHAPSKSALGEFRTLIYSHGFRSWVEAVTGIAVSSECDFSAARYGPGHFLSCHDDDLAERRVAFVYYLVPEDWGVEDGGGLELFDHRRNLSSVETGKDAVEWGEDWAPVPGEMKKVLMPRRNSMVLFAVSASSFHQVQEVLAREGRKGDRLSISGWFRGAPLPRPPPHPCLFRPSSHYTRKMEVTEDAGVVGMEMVTPAYLDMENLGMMQASFQENQFLSLDNFLLPKWYATFYKAMGVQPWQHCGPLNLRSLYTITPTTITTSSSSPSSSPLTTTILPFLLSTQFTTWIEAATGFPASHLNSAYPAIRALTTGSYTLLSDTFHKKKSKGGGDGGGGGGGGGGGEGSSAASASVPRSKEGGGEEGEEEEEDVGPCLVVVLGFQLAGEWDDEDGGYIVATHDGEEIGRFASKSNSIHMFVAVPGVTDFFTKRITSSAPENKYEIIVKYPLPLADDEEEEERPEDD